jgi:uncharacterized protein YkwD
MVALLGVGLASVTSCTGGTQPSKVGSQPSWRNAGSAQEQGGTSAPSRPLPRPMVFAPASPATMFYNDPPVAPAPSWPLADTISAAIQEYCRTAGIEPPRPDGRLYQAAAELADVIPEDAPLAYPIIEFALQRQGIIEPSPHLLPVAGTLDQPQSILQQLATRLPVILSSQTITRFGIGVTRGDGPGRDLLVILLQASHVKTKPIPREVPGGGAIDIEGQALADFRDPQVFVTRDDGSVVKESLQRQGRQGFRARLSCRGRRGRQQVEITANNSGGSSVLANFPVWCNEKAPASVTIMPSEDDITPVATAAEAEARMLALVNRDRQKNGLGPLALSVELSAVARAHGKDMRDNGFVAHVSPTTGSADDRVKSAKIRTSLVLENVARAYGVGEAQAGLMNSPGHRANLLSDRATHVGIGIVFEDSGSEGRVMYITQLFMRVPPDITLQQARTALQDKIAAKRSRVRHDSALAKVAQAYAQDVVAAGWPEKQAAAWRDRKFDPLRPRFARVGTAVVTVIDIDSLDIDQAFRETWITHYGLGVARGKHDEFGDNAMFIVLLMAQAR